MPRKEQFKADRFLLVADLKESEADMAGAPKPRRLAKEVLEMKAVEPERVKARPEATKLEPLRKEELVS